ncbi:MAG: hypothetical protein H0U12_07240 [Thermoleophilaceae bacterium]|nr:hypothetical protein [Thermoleophilaceae bacterium]
MSFEEDPEVIADLKLRAYSEHDTSRARPSRDRIGRWAPDKTVGAWRCRRSGCAGLFAVTAEAVEHVEIFNRELARRGEDAIDLRQVAWCDGCRAAWLASRSTKARERVDAIAELVRELKASNQPRTLTEQIKQLRKWNHPDLDGLLSAIEERLRSGKGKRERKDSF